MSPPRAEIGDPGLASAPEIIVVLGGGVRAGAQSASTARRAEAAEALARERPNAILILSGLASFHPVAGPSEAELMATVLRESGVAADRLRLEDESRDTIGNAVLTAARYLVGLAPRPLTVVTSPFHLERALFIFRRVLGPSWPVAGSPSAPLPGDDERARQEQTYFEVAREVLAGLEPGDLAGAAARLRQRWPEYYGDVARLDPGRLG
ncbi:MAG: YdcF family protein [Candidatus Limnocylindria bacterium]